MIVSKPEINQNKNRNNILNVASFLAFKEFPVFCFQINDSNKDNQQKGWIKCILKIHYYLLYGAM
jgi:hypothetical protein